MMARARRPRSRALISIAIRLQQSWSSSDYLRGVLVRMPSVEGATMWTPSCGGRESWLTAFHTLFFHRFKRREMSVVESVIDNTRHVQHHAGQLNLILRLVESRGSHWIFGQGEA